MLTLDDDLRETLATAVDNNNPVAVAYIDLGGTSYCATGLGRETVLQTRL